MRFLLIATLSLIAFSCASEKVTENTYFGGEIVNPNDSYVVLYKNEQLIDSFELDNNNRFMINLGEEFKEGLYYFVHKPEQQYIFLEKGDSILIRLNTYDFDESLVFTGIGSEKNNFLIDMFLLHEDEEKLVEEYFNLEPADFLSRMDSLKQMKFEQYDDLVLNFELTDNAKNLVQASIDFPHYYNKEIYPYMHKKSKSLKELESLPEDFYNHRENLNYDDDRLSYFRPYLDYMVYHFNNLSYHDCKKNCDHHDPNTKRSFHFYTHKLKLIDSVVKNESLRDNLFRNTAYAYFLRFQNPSSNKNFIASFNKYSQNSNHIDEINGLYKSIQNLQEGNLIPPVSLVRTDGSITSSNNILKENTVYYFWSINQKNHMKNINAHVNALKKKYPSYSFVGININEDHTRWKSTLNSMKWDSSNQYRCASFNEISRKFVIDGLNKAVIVKGDGTIVNAFSNIYEADFEKTLKNLAYNNK